MRRDGARDYESAYMFELDRTYPNMRNRVGMFDAWRGSGYCAETLPSSKRSSTARVESGLCYTLLSGIWWALVGAIITCAYTIGVVNLLRLL